MASVSLSSVFSVVLFGAVPTSLARLLAYAIFYGALAGQSSGYGLPFFH